MFVTPVLLCAAAGAGFVDSIGGGGGLLTVPALLSTPIPPGLLLGTNKASSTIGSLAALVRYGKSGLIPKRTPMSWLLLAIYSTPAAVLGAYVASQDAVTQRLGVLVPVLQLTVMVFLSWKWFLSKAPKPPELHKDDFTFAGKTKSGIAAVSFYDGLFGPGTGTFFLSLFESQGLSTLNANALTKVFNFYSNLGALAFFALSSRVDWATGLSMAACFLAGNWLGASLVLRKGGSLVRGFVLVVSAVSLVRYIWTHPDLLTGLFH